MYLDGILEGAVEGSKGTSACDRLQATGDRLQTLPMTRRQVKKRKKASRGGEADVG